MSESQSPLAETAGYRNEVGKISVPARLEINTSEIVVVPLNDLHVRRDFRCTDRAIQNFCRSGIDRHNRRNIIRAFVAVPRDCIDVVGFYYLTTTSWEHDAVNREIADQFGFLDKIPAVYLGMLGVHTSVARQGIGTALLVDAFKRALVIADNAGVWALTLDATDETAAAYYEKFDFERITPGGLEMYIPIGTLRQLF